jgi:hypothetical protein
MGPDRYIRFRLMARLVPLGPEHNESDHAAR